MSNPTATNHQTGERFELVNGVWQSIGRAVGKLETAARNLSGGILENVGNAPTAMLGSFVEGAMGLGNNFGEQRVDPALMGDAVASLGPRKDEILAGAQIIGEKMAQNHTGSDIPVSSFQDAKANQQNISQAAAEQHPFLNSATNIGADVATLLAVRQPGSKSRAIWDMNQAHAVRLLDDAGKAATTELLPAAKNLKQFFGSELSASPLFASLQRGATKAGEAGLDGLILGVMNQQDPMQTAAIGAGAQVGSSLLASMLTGFKGTGSWGTRLALEAASIMAVLQVGRSLVPGEDASPISDFGAAFDKIVPAAVLGIFGSLAGGGRLTGTKSFQKLREVAPELIEATQSGVRGVSLDLLNGLFADTRAQAVIEKLSKDPNAFGPTVGRRIERAISTGDSDLSKVLDNLESSSRQFRTQVQDLMTEANQ